MVGMKYLTKVLSMTMMVLQMLHRLDILKILH
jgi:hypothetical protein